jgi:predicted dehydrogenase
VFCEKPAAKNFKEFEDMFSASKSLNKKFMIYQPYRISKETRALKEILSQGKIGPVYMIRRNWFEYSRRSDWQSLKKFGGGMLSNYGSHFLDQLFYLTEYKSRSVNCIHRNLISPGDAEDFVKVLIETENRTILDVEVNLASAHQLPSWQILGKYGSIVLEDETQSWKLKYCNPKDMIGIRVSTDLAAKDRKYRNGENIEWVEEVFPFDDLPEVDYYDKCYDYFALNKPPLVPIWQTRELMRVLDCCSKIGNHLNLPIECSPSHISSKIIEQKRVY